LAGRSGLTIESLADEQGGTGLDKQQINPWSWQDKFGFSQAWRVEGAQAVVFLSGQGPILPDGQVLQADFEGQARLTFENLQTVLEQAGLGFESVVKLTAYFTDLTNLRTFSKVRDEFTNTSAPPASTVVEVPSLALPGMTLEVEAIAVA
jgi:enamine deaminase RidA (YjgF/YER057c/UK114 family)